MRNKHCHCFLKQFIEKLYGKSQNKRNKKETSFVTEIMMSFWHQQFGTSVLFVVFSTLCHWQLLETKGVSSFWINHNETDNQSVIGSSASREKGILVCELGDERGFFAILWRSGGWSHNRKKSASVSEPAVSTPSTEFQKEGWIWCWGIRASKGIKPKTKDNIWDSSHTPSCCWV